MPTFRPTFDPYPYMNRLLLVIVCSFAALFAGCSRKAKEISESAKAEAATFANEAQFAMTIREFSRAEELFQRAVKIHEDKPEYWVALGMARRKQENKDGARKAYKEALSIHVARYKEEKKPEELAQQAFVTALLGKTDDALKLLEKGLQDHPDSALLKKMADPRGLPRTFKSEDFKNLSV